VKCKAPCLTFCNCIATCWLISAGTSFAITIYPSVHNPDEGTRPATSQPNDRSRADAIDQFQVTHSAYGAACNSVINIGELSASLSKLQLGSKGAESFYKALGMTPHKPQTPCYDQTVKTTSPTYLASNGADRMSFSLGDEPDHATRASISFRAWGRGPIRGTGNYYHWTGHHGCSRLRCTSYPL
jgi:hypothetical protein